MKREEFIPAFIHARKVSYCKFVAAGEMSPAEALLGLRDGKRDAATAWRSLHPDDRAKPLKHFFATTMRQPDPLGSPVDWLKPSTVVEHPLESAAAAGFLAGLRSQARDVLNRMPHSYPELVTLAEKLAKDPNHPA